MFRCSRVHPTSRSYGLARCRLQLPSKQGFRNALRIAEPTLIALLFAGLSSSVANAQGTMDFSGAQTLMGTFKTFAMYAGAVICLGGLIFAGIRMMSGRFQDAIPGLFGALFGAGVLTSAWLKAHFVLSPKVRACTSTAA